MQEPGCDRASVEPEVESGKGSAQEGKLSALEVIDTLPPREPTGQDGAASGQGLDVRPWCRSYESGPQRLRCEPDRYSALPPLGASREIVACFARSGHWMNVVLMGISTVFGSERSRPAPPAPSRDPPVR
jgi:hypothetical protein